MSRVALSQNMLILSRSYVLRMMLSFFTFMIDFTMNMKGGSIISPYFKNTLEFFIFLGTVIIL